MSAQLRPITGQAPQRPDADAIRRDTLDAVNRRLTDEIARAERWRATAVSGLAGLVVGAAFVWLIYSGAALTGGAIANTDRKLDRLEAATADLAK